MRTVADLRRALIEETSDLENPVRLAAVVRLARRRRLTRAGAAACAALTVLALALWAATGPRAVRTPEPLGTPKATQSVPSVPFRVHPSFPTVGQVITTGVPVGSGYQFVLRFGGDATQASLRGGLLNVQTGEVRDLGEPIGLQQSERTGGGFTVLEQLIDRSGGVIDYGLYIGDVGSIVVRSGGIRYPATLARWTVNRKFTVFWVDHGGTPVPGETNKPVDHAANQPTATAYDAAGHQIGTSAGKLFVRTDMDINISDSPMMGALIDTRVPLSGGGTLVLWFAGTEESAVLKAGRRDAAGAISELKDLAAIAMPPQPVGFYHGLADLPGAGGTHIMLGEYVGPAAKIQAGAPGRAEIGRASCRERV